MTDQIDGKAVDRAHREGYEKGLRASELALGTLLAALPLDRIVSAGATVRDLAEAIKRVVSERDALQAQVEWLNAEHGRLQTKACGAVDAARDLSLKLSAALAREGAVAMEVREGIAKLRTDPDSSVMREAYWSKTWEACLDRVFDLIPTDAAAALARREDEVIELVAGYMDEHGIGNVQDRERVRALKRSGKETG